VRYTGTADVNDASEALAVCQEIRQAGISVRKASHIWRGRQRQQLGKYVDRGAPAIDLIEVGFVNQPGQHATFRLF
jgi:hypothetical protein